LEEDDERDLGCHIYPNVSVQNNTPYPASGTVSYLSCDSDNYSENPDSSWTAGSRGLCGGCLVHTISGFITKPGEATPLACTTFTSSGTGYATFAVVMNMDQVGCTVVHI